MSEHGYHRLTRELIESLQGTAGEFAQVARMHDEASVQRSYEISCNELANARLSAHHGDDARLGEALLRFDQAARERMFVRNLYASRER
jgi:hypothetical protein